MASETNINNSQQSLNVTYDKDAEYTQTPLYKAFLPLMVSLKLIIATDPIPVPDASSYHAIKAFSTIIYIFLSALWVFPSAM